MNIPTLPLCKGYSLGPVAVDVETDTPEVGGWLESFLTPSIDVIPFGGGELRIRYIGAAEEFDALARASTAASGSIACFALDRSILAYPGWDDHGCRVLVDRDRECFFRFQNEHVDVVARPGNRRSRHGLMRVVREVLTTRRLARGGALDLHGAAFEIDGSAVIIAGHKRAGKTTMLCHALASGVTRLVANDRILVDVDSEPQQIQGIPTIVSIRPETRRAFPRLNGGTFALPSEFAARFGSSSVRSAPLGAVVFPEITSEVDAWSLEPISRRDGLDELATCTYGLNRDGAARTIFDVSGGSAGSRPEPRALLERLAADVRFFRCRLGARAYDGPAEAWLRAVSY